MTGRTAPTARMPLAQHLREARVRAVRAAAALLVGAVAGYLLSDAIFDVLREPIEQLAASRDASLNFDTVTSAFDLRLRVALVAGIVLSSPVWLYEILAFLSPGLTRRERRFTLGFVAAAVPLFAAGCAMGLAIFPHMVELLAGFASDDDSTVLQASTYIDFVLKVVLATGIAFVLPVFVVVLNLLGVLSARTILRGWRLALVGIVLFSALVTPAADVFSMFLVAVPMALLYLAAVLVVLVRERRMRRRAPEEQELAAPELATPTTPAA
ncbi:twin-arginine translocase subunit TatC [Homoserinibacter sp. GY 40078]|uniref:twin-arginine translocase subunit TatC n=1 Tax=Homoserinibacter sp. GY 40078 TaxID=2603275 RepID=UPI0021082AA4|nr:twin-arginine translocase subunit TatC [Homoserinibacter sp. GY 40078]